MERKVKDLIAALEAAGVPEPELLQQVDFLLRQAGIDPETIRYERVQA